MISSREAAEAKSPWISVLVAALFLLPIPGTSALALQIDKTGTVYHVVDGDTIDVSSVGRVRLADVDSPEQGQVGYHEAKDYTTSLVLHQEAYLDVDDVHGTDGYGRWVCVVYVRHNSTHLLNVNKALLVRGVAVVRDFPNEFNPTDWTLYVYYPLNSPPGTPSPGTPSTPLPSTAPPSTNEGPLFILGLGLGGAALVLAVIIVVLLIKRRHERP